MKPGAFKPGVELASSHHELVVRLSPRHDFPQAQWRELVLLPPETLRRKPVTRPGAHVHVVVLVPGGSPGRVIRPPAARHDPRLRRVDTGHPPGEAHGGWCSIERRRALAEPLAAPIGRGVVDRDELE